MTMAHKKRTIKNLNKIQPSSNQVPEQHVQDNLPADIETVFDKNNDYERETDEEFQNVHTRPASIADTSAFAVSLISSNAIMKLPSNQLADFNIESTDTCESFNEFAPSTLKARLMMRSGCPPAQYEEKYRISAWLSVSGVIKKASSDAPMMACSKFCNC